jgi:hypothetical protein
MEQTLQLSESTSVVLDGSGAGVARIGPQRAGVRWELSSVALSATVSDPQPTALVYLGSAAPGSFLGGSYSGAQDTASTTAVLFSGQYLTIAWSGGAAGARATATVLGKLVRSA